MKYLESATPLSAFVWHWRPQPDDVFFLCTMCQPGNLDNRYNETNLAGCNKAKSFWFQVTSQRDENVDEWESHSQESRTLSPIRNGRRGRLGG